MKTQTITEILEEFDKEFFGTHINMSEGNHNVGEDNCSKKIKSFIRQTLQAQRKEVEEETLRNVRAALLSGNNAKQMVEVIDEKLQTLKDKRV